MAPKTRRPHQDVSDLAAHSDAIDVLYRKVVRQGNSRTVAFKDWLNGWDTVKITLLRKDAKSIFVRIEKLEGANSDGSQTDTV